MVERNMVANNVLIPSMLYFLQFGVVLRLVFLKSLAKLKISFGQGSLLKPKLACHGKSITSNGMMEA